MMVKIKENGYTLIEMMVGITIFVILGTIVSGIVLYSSRNSAKSESMSKVRENLDFTVQVMSRQLRYAKSIESCSSIAINYRDQNNNPTSFSRSGSPDNYSIASGSAKLTSPEIQVTNVDFSCTEKTTTEPATVRIKFTAKTLQNVTGVQSDEINVDTLVTLRN